MSRREILVAGIAVAIVFAGHSATARAAAATVQPTVLKHDDGSSDGKKSIAGGGHATFFTRPPGEWVVTHVQIYGSRYGQAMPPSEDVSISLLDGSLKPITEWKKPYALFGRSDAKWHRLAAEEFDQGLEDCQHRSFLPTRTDRKLKCKEKDVLCLWILPGFPHIFTSGGFFLLREART